MVILRLSLTVCLLFTLSTYSIIRTHLKQRRYPVNILDTLERKLGRHFGIPNLMLYIIYGNVITFILDLIGIRISYYLALIPSLVMQGQIWRLVTFIFVAPSINPLFAIFFFYLYYMIGNTLERQWGTFRFSLYYGIGMLGVILASFTTGSIGTSDYLNLSLFLAFATLFPDMQFLIMFIIPVKIKWLAALDIAFLLYLFIIGGLGTRVLIVLSLLNVILFVSSKLITNQKQHKRRKKFETSSRVIDDVPFHRCTVCGITEKDDPKMQFRYCSQCNGTHEYCMNHLHNHEHK